MSIRGIVLPALFLLSTGAICQASYVWLSSSPETTTLGEVPRVRTSSDIAGGKLYVWAQPDEGKTLENWSLNLRTTEPGVVNFHRVIVHNPTYQGVTGPFESTIRRYQTVIDSTRNDLSNVVYEDLLRFGVYTFNVTDLGELADEAVASNPELGKVLGAGLNSSVGHLDPLYDALSNAFLLATIDYDVVGTGETDLYLQIGSLGILNRGEQSVDHLVVLGDINDPPLRGGQLDYRDPDGRLTHIRERETDSATPDATIIVQDDLRDGFAVPEPSALCLGMMSLLGAVVLIARCRVAA